MTTLVLRGGRIIDPVQGLDAQRDVLIRNGRVEALEPPGVLARMAPGSSTGDDVSVRDVSGAIVTPGLIDLHGHWYLGSAYGVEAAVSLRGGVTTAVDAGTAGFVNFASFRRQSIDGAQLAVRAFVNVAALGIPYPITGELEDLRYARPKETAAVIREHRDVAVGVKVRLSGAGPNAGPAFEAAREAAELASVPIMVDIGDERDLMPGLLDRMRPGDILTHCFTGLARGIRGPDGRLAPEARGARRRGVRFDIGHGGGSFSFATARMALAEGFPPDSISTDIHRYSIEGPVYDLLTTMAKFLHLGLELPDVVARVTTGPAESIGLPAPSLRPGSPADVAVFRVVESPTQLVDAARVPETAAVRLAAVLTVVAGRVVEPGDVPLSIRPLTPLDRVLLGNGNGPLQDGASAPG